MGEVYRATDPNLKRQVAIKILPASVAGFTDLSAAPEGRKRGRSGDDRIGRAVTSTGLHSTAAGNTHE
jgi:hypothetical protein